MKKAALLTLLLVFSSLSVLAGFTRPIEAHGSVYIRADGSIDPSTANIARVDAAIYTFIGNVNESLVVEKNNIVIDGTGYILQGAGELNSKGIDLNGRSNVTIRNTEIKGFYYGVYLYSSSNNTISKSKIKNNFDGIYLVRSSNNTISKNNVTNNENGILFNYSSDNLLESNLLDGNKYGLGFLGLELNHFLHLVDTSNLVNGKPVYYLIGKHDLSINPSTHPAVGFLALINSTNITVEGMTLTNNRQGLLLAHTNSTRIQNNNVTNNLRGIWLDNSSNNTITGNSEVMNLEGISLNESSNNTISENNITMNIDGIVVTWSSNNVICKNTITNNFNGTRLYETLDSNIYENDIAENINLGINLVGSSGNTISRNEITRNTKGIVLEESSNNRIYHNNLVDNTQQASIEITGYSNFWNEYYPSGGNYWSDYAGVDLKSGPNQDEPNSDGIGDTVYIINAYNRDHYPLMKPYPEAHAIIILWPQNNSYATMSIPLTFNVNVLTSWMGHSLDGQENVTIVGNTTLTNLLEGSHRVVIYANDTAGTTWRSVTVHFTVDITPPTVSVLSPENKTYLVNDIPLTFTLSEATSWIGYIIDNQGVTITGNTTLSELSEGWHSLTVYAKDRVENTGSSEIIFFTIETKKEEPFPTWTIVLIVIIIVVAAALLVYFTKYKKAT